MQDETVSLTAAEWNVMECLWDESPRTVMQMVALLKKRTGWAKSTSTTMISRMEKKGLIYRDGDEKPKHYYPAVRRKDAVSRETKTFVERVFRGSVSMMMHTVVWDQNLTQEEIDELYAILKKAEVHIDD